ncbi:fork-head transcriptional regulator 2 [Podospora fimiseda]|uniref:Fork-head transcriptional regulator 2 n=1 Tax=Podospora fimiseda TaxID=252190 RepID=A0AAN7GUP4_9PEZI|nr:fork-head transcriptional regulator 2 [Podospora fimiseda]
MPAQAEDATGEGANATEIPNEGDSSLIADQSDTNLEDDDLVTRVTQHLLTAPGQVQASKDYANAIHEHNKDGVSAYAKLSAVDWTYYITRLKVNIGRCSDPAAQPKHEVPATVSQESVEEQEDPNTIHVDLGPSKLISRQHAVIYFHREKEEWWLEAKGRNALKVDGALWKQGQSGALRSGEVIEVGGVEMMFVLPVNLARIQIATPYLERAGIIKPEPTPVQQSRHPLPSGDGLHSSSPGRSARQSGQKPLAPAPPDYRRLGTPPSSLRRPMGGLLAHTPMGEGTSTMLMSNHTELDLSLEENSHIKPQFSYAQMITQAIMQTEERKLTLNGIYNYILTSYSYYRMQPQGGWQNSIRHNLSLNKNFEKVPRQTDEPGKGMKWQIVPESRDEMIAQAWRGGRGGHRGVSSNPSSPNQLNYITSGPRDMAAAREPASVRKRKVSPSGSPQPRAAGIRESHSTPVRANRKPLPDEPGAGIDGTPLPKLRRPNPSSTLGTVETAPDSPTLTSGFLQEDGASFVTPAPHRVHPRLAPPSTAQRPSAHMATSSPAPFWKYADVGSTPLKPASFDSPTKVKNGDEGDITIGIHPPSSSPPRQSSRSKSPVLSQSPTRTGSRAGAAPISVPVAPALDTESPSPVAVDEEVGFDLTKGFQSIGSYHAPVGHGKQVPPASNGDLTASGSV